MIVLKGGYFLGGRRIEKIPLPAKVDNKIYTEYIAGCLFPRFRWRAPPHWIHLWFH